MTRRRGQNGNVWNSHKSTKVLQLFCIVLLLVLTGLIFATSNRYIALRATISEDALWAVSQLDREARMLSIDLQHAALAAKLDDETLEGLAVKYDIVYSRITILRAETFSRIIDSSPSSKWQMKEFEETANSMEGFFDGIAGGRRPALPELLAVNAKVEKMLELCNELLSEVGSMTFEEQTSAKSDLAKLQFSTTITAMLLAGAVITLFLLLRFQMAGMQKAKQVLEEEAATLKDRIDAAVSDIRSREDEIIERLSMAAGHKDSETEMHTRRVGAYTAAIARQLGMSDEECQDMKLASLMHDIGKVGIPDAVLQKVGKLTDAERLVINTHTTIGAKILEGSKAPLLQLGATIAESHHERWDGKGYPEGLVGEAIPLAGRIVALADNFDALTSPRIYKPAWTVENAVDYIRQNAGTHFDPECVAAFDRALSEIVEIQESLFEMPQAAKFA